MSAITQAAADRLPGPQNVMLGIGLKVGSVTIFMAMQTMLKAAEGVPTGELVFFRSFFGMLPVFAFLAWRRELGLAFRTQRPLAHLWRGLIGVSSMALGFFALSKLPLPESVGISYATPLFVVILGAVFLHERVHLYRWSAVIIGLVGVALIMWPRLTFFTGGSGGEEAIGALAALLAAIGAGFAMLQVRRLVSTERSTTIVLYFFVSASVFALCTLPFGWVWPSPQQWLLLVGAGITGGIAQILLTECYRHADMSVIAPFEYTSLLLSLVIGYTIFADIPTMEMLAGGALVAAAGIFIVVRERQLGLKRARAAASATPQG